jgi:hypothetical protein
MSLLMGDLEAGQRSPLFRFMGSVFAFYLLCDVRLPGTGDKAVEKRKMPGSPRRCNTVLTSFKYSRSALIVKVTCRKPSLQSVIL